MPLDKHTLQRFFDADFQFEERLCGELTHFDGSMHWHLIYDEGRGFLRIAADQNPASCAFPTVEIEGLYSDSSEASLNSGEAVLILHPCGVSDVSHYVSITKMKSGRLSLSTTTGRPTQRA